MERKFSESKMFFQVVDKLERIKKKEKNIWICSVTQTQQPNQSIRCDIFNSNWQWLKIFMPSIAIYRNRTLHLLGMHATWADKRPLLFLYFIFYAKTYLFRLFMSMYSLSISLSLLLQFFFLLRFNTLYQSIQNEIITIAKNKSYLCCLSGNYQFLSFKKIFILFSLITFESSKQLNKK